MPSGGVHGVPTRCLSTLLVQNLALVVLVLGYVLLGGLVFQRLESDHELRQRAAVRHFRDECLRELWLITERLNVLYEQNWTHLVDVQLRKFERSVVEATRHSGQELRDRELHWTYSGAVLYSVTIITTIGYGNIAPRTAEGKVVTMVYALVGVPLMLVCLSNLGTTFAHTFQTAYSHLCCTTSMQRSGKGGGRPVRPHKSEARGTLVAVATDNGGGRPVRPHKSEARGTLVAVATDNGKPVCSLTPEARQLLRKHQPHDRESDDDDPEQTKRPPQHDTPSRVPLIWRAPGESRRAPTPPPRKTPPLRKTPPHRVPPVVVLTGLGLYFSLGAFAFSSWESWSVLDGAYFCFVALSTIGFGDMAPTRVQDSQWQTMACCSYLVFGLVIIAMSFSLLQNEVVTRGKHFASAVGLVKREDMSV